jgi:hypothetical protein
VTHGTPGSTGSDNSHQERVQKWTEALDHVRRALRLLDENGAPADIGAHLDLARHRLTEAIQGSDEDSPD